ncbi:MAG: GNAT family N-acetyltransferase [Cyclobacteriaceae bacterium]
MKVQTKRLSIEEATVKDSPFLYELLNSPNWIKHIGDRGIKSIEDATAYVENSLINSYATLGFGLYKVSRRENNEPIGISGFLKRDYLEHPDIGFATLPKHEGKGYSFEAADALMKFGAQEIGLKTIYAITSDENLVSQKLLVKLGLKAIGKVQPPTNEDELLLYST